MFANEESPNIKKELAIVLKELAGVIDEELFTKLVTIFSKDQNEYVRIPLMEAVVALKVSPNLVRLSDFICAIFLKLGSDESWRVRLTVADKICELLSFSSHKNFRRSLIETYAKLFEDSEAEVRNTCCLKLEHIAEKIGSEPDFDLVLVQLKKLEKDPASYVRGALAGNILRICPMVGKQRTNDHIFPVFLMLMKDESHEIRMTLIKTLDRLNEVINIDVFVQSIIPSIVEIANNRAWRTRIQVTESVPVLARILNRNLFMENMLQMCIGCLSDDVYTVREAGCKLMKKLFTLYKGHEFEKVLMDKVNEMKNSSSYLIRNTILILGKVNIDSFKAKII